MFNLTEHRFYRNYVVTSIISLPAKTAFSEDVKKAQISDTHYGAFYGHWGKKVSFLLFFQKILSLESFAKKSNFFLQTASDMG